jgi:nucleoside-diphosphate-sugar epimerase
LSASRILVTGATGFVGRALVRRLLADGGCVRAAVRPTSDALPEQVESLAVDDIGPATDWRAALAGVGAVVHLAARAHVLHDPSPDSHALYSAVNTRGALRLAEAAAAAGVRRFVFLSSARVHGERSTGAPFTESSLLFADDPYGRSKAAAEGGLASLARESALEPVILRPPLVYGPGARGNFARLVARSPRVPRPIGAGNRRSLLYAAIAGRIVRARPPRGRQGDVHGQRRRGRVDAGAGDRAAPLKARAAGVGSAGLAPPRRCARRPLGRLRAPPRRSRRRQLEVPRLSRLVAGLYAG